MYCTCKKDLFARRTRAHNAEPRPVHTQIAINRFLKNSQLAASTQRSYRGDLEEFAKWLEARGSTIQDIDVRALSDYTAHLGRARTGQRRLSPGTLARKIAAVRSLLRAELGASRVPDLPLQSRRRRHLPTAPNLAEVKKLLEDYSVDSEKISSDEDVKSIEESILEKIN